MTEEHIKGRICAYKLILETIEEGYTTGEIAELLQDFIEELEFILEK